jgi:hypothetical protein
MSTNDFLRLVSYLQQFILILLMFYVVEIMLKNKFQ